MRWSHPKASGDPALLPNPAPCLARAFAGRSAPGGEQRAPVRHTAFSELPHLNGCYPRSVKAHEQSGNRVIMPFIIRYPEQQVLLPRVSTCLVSVTFSSSVFVAPRRLYIDPEKGRENARAEAQLASWKRHLEGAIPSRPTTLRRLLIYTLGAPRSPMLPAPRCSTQAATTTSQCRLRPAHLRYPSAICRLFDIPLDHEWVCKSRRLSRL
jgi:hypothetical protein